MEKSAALSFYFWIRREKYSRLYEKGGMKNVQSDYRNSDHCTAGEGDRPHWRKNRRGETDNKEKTLKSGSC